MNVVPENRDSPHFLGHKATPGKGSARTLTEARSVSRIPSDPVEASPTPAILLSAQIWTGAHNGKRDVYSKEGGFTHFVDLYGISFTGFQIFTDFIESFTDLRFFTDFQNFRFSAD